MNFVFLVADNFGNRIESAPGRFVGPLARFFGVAFNFIFELFNNNITLGIALGLSIILITFLMRTLILPLSMKSHKSMMQMHRIAPEVNAIKQKYEGRTSVEDKRKMQMEVQQLYYKHGANPLIGCLPMLLTMPVFIGLNFIMRQAHLYVNYIGNIYDRISAHLIQALPVTEYAHFWTQRIYNMVPSNYGTFYFDNIEDMSRAVSRFTSEQWNIIREAMSTCGNVVYECVCANVVYLNQLIERREYVETFLGLNMSNVAGFGWPGIIIPLLSVVTTFISSYLIQQRQPNADPAQKMQQRIMLFGMPLFLGFITAQMAMGVGVFWVTGNIYQMGQHYLLTKYYNRKEL